MSEWVSEWVCEWVGGWVGVRVGERASETAQHRIATTSRHEANTDTKKNISHDVCTAEWRRGTRVKWPKPSPSPEYVERWRAKDAVVRGDYCVPAAVVEPCPGCRGKVSRNGLNRGPDPTGRDIPRVKVGDLRGVGPVLFPLFKWDLGAVKAVRDDAGVVEPNLASPRVAARGPAVVRAEAVWVPLQLEPAKVGMAIKTTMEHAPRAPSVGGPFEPPAMVERQQNRPPRAIRHGCRACGARWHGKVGKEEEKHLHSANKATVTGVTGGDWAPHGHLVTFVRPT